MPLLFEKKAVAWSFNSANTKQTNDRFWEFDTTCLLSSPIIEYTKVTDIAWRAALDNVQRKQQLLRDFRSQAIKAGSQASPSKEPLDHFVFHHDGNATSKCQIGFPEQFVSEQPSHSAGEAKRRSVLGQFYFQTETRHQTQQAVVELWQQQQHHASQKGAQPSGGILLQFFGSVYHKDRKYHNLFRFEFVWNLVDDNFRRGRHLGRLGISVQANNCTSASSRGDIQSTFELGGTGSSCGHYFFHHRLVYVVFDNLQLHQLGIWEPIFAATTATTTNCSVDAARIGILPNQHDTTTATTILSLGCHGLQRSDHDVQRQSQQQHCGSCRALQHVCH